MRIKNKGAMSKMENEFQAQQRVPSYVNWGALILTPFWMLRNGLWLTFLSYVIGALLARWTPLMFSVFLFFYGTRLSWGAGNRWRSYEEFCESQENWTFSALIAAGFVLLVFALQVLTFHQGQ
jgi:uncharacterized membrane protein